MTETGYPTFDDTINQTNRWLNEIGETLGGEKQRAYHALRGVLFALRDRSMPQEAFHLSAQLPMLVRGLFWEGYRPVDKPERFRSREEFLEKVSEGFATAPAIDPEEAARAVFGVLARHVPEGEVADVKQGLPKPVQELFPQG